MKAEAPGWLIRALLALARRLMPPGRREWSEAMRAEAAYLPESSRLHWAFGCLIAAARLRFTPMQTGSLRISRWVLLIEMLVCFAPTCVGWFAFTFGPSGVIWLNDEIIDKFFLVSDWGKWMLGLMITYAISGWLGPIGLFLGLRLALRRKGLGKPALGWVLIALTTLQSAAYILWGLQLDNYFLKGGFLQIFVSFTALPLIGVLHLMYLSRPAAPAPGDARLTAG